MNSDPSKEHELEQLIDRELHKLQDLSAPSTLLPRVLAAIQLRALPWWQRPWLTWPVPFKLISLVLFLSITSLAVYGGWLVWNGGGQTVVAENSNRLLQPVLQLGEVLNILGKALWLLVSSINRTWLLITASVMFLAYLSCVGLGTLCFRFATSSRTHAS
ncbi:MAG: hypothetical protein AB1813_14450 [Verrucomicrobiota bacterium]